MTNIHIPPEAVTKKRITQAELKELLNYDQDSGLFTWARPVKNGSIPAGTKAGAINSNGYLRIEIKNRIYMAHRLAWLYVTGSWPDGIIDHIDTCKNNNRFSNLRLATPAENGWNCKAPSTNSTGVKGVRWHKTNKRWCAALKVNGKDVHVGTFRSLEQAIFAITAARTAYHGEFANHDASKLEGKDG